MADTTASKRANPEQILRAARDLRLIEAYRSGRREAFDELVRSYDAHVRLQNALGDASEIHRASDDPYYACYDALTQEKFERAIDALPEAFRTVVAMREVEDLSYEEIAVQTGISVGTVRSRLSRARARLKTLLRPALLEPAA